MNVHCYILNVHTHISKHRAKRKKYIYETFVKPYFYYENNSLYKNYIIYFFNHFLREKNTPSWYFMLWNSRTRWNHSRDTARGCRRAAPYRRRQYLPSRPVPRWRPIEIQTFPRPRAAPSAPRAPLPAQCHRPPLRLSYKCVHSFEMRVRSLGMVLLQVKEIVGIGTMWV